MIYMNIYDMCTCFKISTGMILTAQVSGDPVTSPILYHLTPMSSVSYLPILPMLDGCLKIISQKQHIEISWNRAPHQKKHQKMGGYPRVDIDKDVENLWKTYSFPKFFQWFHLQVHLFPGGIWGHFQVLKMSEAPPERSDSEVPLVSTHRDFWRNTGNIWEIIVNI